MIRVGKASGGCVSGGADVVGADAVGADAVGGRRRSARVFPLRLLRFQRQ